MSFLYPFFIAFFIIFLSELCDKTQLLVISFSSKLKSYIILFGVAIGTFLSHGVAILFGSAIGSLQNPFFHNILMFFTYLSFLFFGVITFIKREDNEEISHVSKRGFLHNISKLPIGYILVIAFCIATGEIGDKTFLAALGLGISYPECKFFLVLGAILGMVLSDYLAILFGKFLSSKISPHMMSVLSGIIFLLFGIVGMVKFFINNVWIIL